MGMQFHANAKMDYGHSDHVPRSILSPVLLNCNWISLKVDFISNVDTWCGSMIGSAMREHKRRVFRIHLSHDSGCGTWSMIDCLWCNYCSQCNFAVTSSVVFISMTSTENKQCWATVRYRMSLKIRHYGARGPITDNAFPWNDGKDLSWNFWTTFWRFQSPWLVDWPTHRAC